MKILFMTVLYIRMSDEICTNMRKIMKIWKEFFFLKLWLGWYGDVVYPRDSAFNVKYFESIKYKMTKKVIC